MNLLTFAACFSLVPLGFVTPESIEKQALATYDINVSMDVVKGGPTLDDLMSHLDQYDDICSANARQQISSTALRGFEIDSHVTAYMKYKVSCFISQAKDHHLPMSFEITVEKKNK